MTSQQRLSPATTEKLPERGAAPHIHHDYLRVNTVAALLDVSRKRVYHLIEQGRVDAIKLGPRQTRVSRASLEHFIRSLREKACKEC